MISHMFLPSLSLFLLGVALRVSQRLLYGARGPAPDDAVYLFTRVMAWGLLLIPGGVFLVSTMHWVSLILLALIFEALVELIVARRHAQRESAWRLLMMSLNGKQPLVEGLRFHQARFSGIVGRWYRRLIDDLENGATLVDAVCANRRALPREAPAYAAMLASSPTPAADALEVDELQDVAFADAQQHIFQRFAYLATVSVMMTAVVAFVTIKIGPSVEDIYSDFNLQLPSLTKSFLYFSGRYGPFLGIPIMTAFAVVILGGFVVGILYLCDVPVLRPLGDRVGFTRHRAHILRLLASSIAHGAPVAETLSRLESGRAAYPSVPVRRRVAAAQRRIDAGHEWTDALERSSLISATDSATLRAAQQVGNLPWAMRMLADRKLRLLAFRWAGIQNLLYTLILLLMGLLVAWYAIAMFYPLVLMIYALT